MDRLYRGRSVFWLAQRYYGKGRFSPQRPYRAGRVFDRKGIVCLQREGLGAVLTNRVRLAEDLDLLLEDTTEYGTIGGQLPGLFIYYGEKQLDLSGLASKDQILAVLELELTDLLQEEAFVILAVR